MRYADVPEQLRGRPFTLAQAEAAGLSRRALQSAPWRHLFRGVWVHCSVELTREVRFEAVRLVLPEHAVVCGITAAWLHGADVRHEDDLDVDVSFPKGRRRPVRAGVRMSQETLAPTDISVVDGVRVTSPVRTAFDCLRLLRGVQRLIVADALTHLRVTSVDELISYFASQRRLRNLRIGAALLDHVEPRTESPMETRLRIGLVESGLPRPEAQWEVFDRAGDFVARLDLAYPDLKIAIEYDGAWHWHRRRADDRRRAAVRALGWIVLVFSSEDVFGDIVRVGAQVRAAVRSVQRTASSAS
jgi:very-short-patch-repair endonuclease